MGKYYRYYESHIGLIEVTGSKEYIETVSFIYDREKKEESGLGIACLDEAIKQLEEYFNGTRREFKLSYKQQGTEFQQKAWDELVKIPYGKSITYGEQAIRMGNEKASQATGQANGKNKLAIIVPCHRVIGKNKSMTGYAGGVKRKEWLLKHEGAIK